jgi:hypothetical protein
VDRHDSGGGVDGTGQFHGKEGEMTSVSVKATLVLAAALGAGASTDSFAQDLIPSAVDVHRDLLFTAVPPCRIVDTRLGGGALVVGVPRDLFVTGTGHTGQGGRADGCGVPETAAAVVLNFVAVNPAGAGHLTVWPYSTPPVGQPNASAINYAAVRDLFSPATPLNIANGLVVPICSPIFTTCDFDLRVQANANAVHLVIDVMGYFTAHPPDINAPSPGEKAALAGTSGVPSGANRYVTNADPRNSNARPPTLHGDDAHDATVASLSGGRVPTAELGTGAAGVGTFLRGDRTWAAPPVPAPIVSLITYASGATTNAPNDTPVRVRTMGSFNKAGAGTAITLVWNTTVFTDGPSLSHCQYQLRIDDAIATGLGNHSGVVVFAGHDDVSPTARWTGLAPGPHTISAWVRGNATRCIENAGVFQKHIYVIEQ